MNVNQTLEQRGERYGDFKDVAFITQSFMSVISTGCQSNALNPSQRTALFMISNKIARIISGDPRYIDNWHDIAGYALLIEKELQEEKE